MADVLSHDDYVKILQARFNNPKIKYESVNFLSLTENLEGFAGEHNIFKVTYSLDGVKHTANFFLKSKPNGEANAQMVEKLMTYEKEIFFYDVLTREYARRGYNTTFAPQIYLCKDSTALVMTDLKTEGYTLLGRTIMYDLPKMKSAINTLAHFHAASLMYEEQKSAELNKKFRLNEEHPVLLQEKFLDFSDPTSIGLIYLNQSKVCFENLINLFDETEDWKKDFIQRMGKIDFQKIMNYELGPRKALGHGDLWSNNMMFKEENGSLHCCLLDYQILRYFNPAFDVLYIIFANTRKEFRDQHMDSLFDYYYEVVQQNFKERNLKLEDVYSKQDFMSSLKYYKLIARFYTTCAHTLTFLDVSKLKDLLKEKPVANLMGEDRPFFVNGAYKHDQLYKDIMQEDLYEVRKMLDFYHFYHNY